MAEYLGLSFLFTPKAYHQTVQTVDSRQCLVSSLATGELRGVYPLPDHFLDREWKWNRFVYPRCKVGVPNLQKRVEKLSYMVHLLTQCGIPSKNVFKSVKRLSLIWQQMKFTDMRKHVNSITTMVCRSVGISRNPDVLSIAYIRLPVYTGDRRFHDNFSVPLWHIRPKLKSDMVRKDLPSPCKSPHFRYGVRVQT